MSFQTVLDKYRRIAYSERDKGDRFERLIQAYLQTDPIYDGKFRKVWLWSEFPYRGDFGGSDIGIDLVALTIEGNYWAIQCKCYQPNTYIDKSEVDTFLSTSSKKFHDEMLESVRFSNRLFIATSNNWSRKAEETIANQSVAVNRIRLWDLENAPVDWDKLDSGLSGSAARLEKKTIRRHQTEALEKTHAYFQKHDRGKLIMACGTGKTFTALRIAEHETASQGLILFLVPSISLLGQTLREWYDDADEPINAICICSDPEVSTKKTRDDDRDLSTKVDLALPASTNVDKIIDQFERIRKNAKPGLTVVFSTYHSLKVIADAQKTLLRDDPTYGVFDMIICDEAHRTTGVALSEEDSSTFIKVHDDAFIQAKKRLYMTATPRLYGDEAKSKAAEEDYILCSMDDDRLYGEEIHRIGFGEAVERNLLTDYKVLILTLSDKDVPPAVQRMISDQKHEITTDDASKLIGCINALSKQFLGEEGIVKASDPEPMRRAVAFCQSIKISKKITNVFNETAEHYIDALPGHKQKQMVRISSKHIDGTMTAPQRDEMLGWLKKGGNDTTNDCRVLTNVRCLSEGVDVPALDAVLFLSARNSQVDVVQSVGRVMRRSTGKQYGYIIIPVMVPSDVEPDKALDDNKRYKVVWTVLNALRAHDDRFNATINKIELNQNRPAQILVGAPETTFEEGEARERTETKGTGANEQLMIQFEQLKDVIYARLVQKVGARLYWEQWAQSVAEIAERQVSRINRLIQEDGKHRKAFDDFLAGLQKNINPSITQQEAVEMLSQHTITKPVFEALFEGYSFVKNNPVSGAMQVMLDLLEAQSLGKDLESLDRFYESVRMRASGIDNAEGKQRIIIELYDKFFKTAFPRMVEKLGIVYTPVEVVDFMLHSVQDVLRQEFGRSLSDEHVHILDPFTGTGTFITRLLQNGFIAPKDLPRKYRHEIHANEIVLLAYYIATVNIENAFHDVMQTREYTPFDGICLTDTFQLGESDGREELFSEMFPKNSERVARQMEAPLRVILGNPPYSVGQKSANDNAQNQEYERLNERISETYAAVSSAGLSKSIYDAYIKAFRWSTDRLDPEHGGMICFVSNGAWLDGNSLDGFRKCLEQEFSSIYVFNLRGNQRTSGELSRREGGKIFGSGSRTPIAITLLVKKPHSAETKAQIHYKDIGDYHNREAKLALLQQFHSIANPELKAQPLSPNEHGDWISQRNDVFGAYIPLTPKKKFDVKTDSFFVVNSLGINTSRDSWCYNSSTTNLEDRVQALINFYNVQRKAFHKAHRENDRLTAKSFLTYDPKKISWSVALERDIEGNNSHYYRAGIIIKALYRPFHKQHLYFSRALNERVSQTPKLFPTPTSENQVIGVPAPGGSKDFTVLIADHVPDLHLNGNTQAFPLYYYEEQSESQGDLFDTDEAGALVRRDGVSDYIFAEARKRYGKRVTKEDIFYYVYGFLHSPEYRKTFANDLKKMLPRIPLVEEPNNFWKFSKAGRELAELHIQYEKIPPHPDVVVQGAEHGDFRVEKMRFPKKGQKDRILYNSKITLSNIPPKAYEYVVNGKSAIEWVMERYQITTHKASGIRNDPNDWAEECGNPRYILDLLLSVINVSVQTVAIVADLPKLTFEE